MRARLFGACGVFDGLCSADAYLRLGPWRSESADAKSSAFDERLAKRAPKAPRRAHVAIERRVRRFGLCRAEETVAARLSGATRSKCLSFPSPPLVLLFQRLPLLPPPLSLPSALLAASLVPARTSRAGVVRGAASFDRSTAVAFCGLFLRPRRFCSWCDAPRAFVLGWMARMRFGSRAARGRLFRRSLAADGRGDLRRRPPLPRAGAVSLGKDSGVARVFGASSAPPLFVSDCASILGCGVVRRPLRTWFGRHVIVCLLTMYFRLFFFFFLFFHRREVPCGCGPPSVSVSLSFSVVALRVRGEFFVGVVVCVRAVSCGLFVRLAEAAPWRRPRSVARTRSASTSFRA